MVKWVKCVKTIPELFIEGDLYQIHCFYPSYITLIDQTGNEVGFCIEKGHEFRDCFKFLYSQKRGTSWDTPRKQ